MLLWFNLLSLVPQFIKLVILFFLSLVLLYYYNTVSWSPWCVLTCDYAQFNVNIVNVRKVFNVVISVVYCDFFVFWITWRAHELIFSIFSNKVFSSNHFLLFSFLNTSLPGLIPSCSQRTTQLCHQLSWWFHDKSMSFSFECEF